mmetsp:Transcript_44345/g.77899  ORF Transcript_44345/g.77899 Transcript_44345/m.77899 type:complete len:596 (+) Transcript_44345:44-1831(+)
MAAPVPDESATIREAFRRFDTNGDGIIDRPDLTRVLTTLDPSLLEGDAVDQMLDVMDANKDGKILYEEFVSWVMKDPSRKPPRLHITPKVFLPSRFEVDIHQRYDLDKLALGEGGYGKVFIANDSKSGRKVAVKQVTKTVDRKRTDTFHTEIDIMKDLDHPCICKLLETFETGPHIYFVMEFCSGGELFDKIIAKGYVSEALTAEVIRQVSSALRYAHSRGICHRDIKPENVVFCSKDENDTRVKLIDWGLSVSFTGTVMRTAVGSFTYAAPEVITSRNITAYTEKCDLWSLGVLTYVTLCGKPPFWGSERQHVAAAMSERYPITGGVWPLVSAEAKQFIKSLLKAAPAERLPIDEVNQHRWLTADVYVVSEQAQAQVLENMKQFSNAGLFSALCSTAVARQLDHHKLQEIHKVFREMDKNGDGYLSVDEVRQCFRKLDFDGSENYREIEDTFNSLDLDGSGVMDYTEFCAGGMGQRAAFQEDALWSAFKAFDVDNTDKVSRSELEKVLQDADVRKAWSSEVCSAVAEKVLKRCDVDGDGQMDFAEWLTCMRESYANNVEGAGKDEKSRDEDGSKWVYDLLARINELPVTEAVAV